jgi:hypothetical protein
MTPKRQVVKSNTPQTRSSVPSFIKIIVSLINEVLQRDYFGVFIIILLLLILAGKVVSYQGVIVIIILIGFGLLYYFNKWLNKD